MRQIGLTTLAIIMIAFTSCYPTRYPGEGNPYPGGDERGGDDGRIYPFSQLGIPKGHLPPPGECKVWFPGRPAGQQPPPMSCASAIRNRPPGAWVITHQGNRFRVNIFKRGGQGILEEIRYYNSN